MLGPSVLQQPSIGLQRFEAQKEHGEIQIRQPFHREPASHIPPAGPEGAPKAWMKTLQSNTTRVVSLILAASLVAPPSCHAFPARETPLARPRSFRFLRLLLRWDRSTPLVLDALRSPPTALMHNSQRLRPLLPPWPSIWTQPLSRLKGVEPCRNCIIIAICPKIAFQITPFPENSLPIPL